EPPRQRSARHEVLGDRLAGTAGVVDPDRRGEDEVGDDDQPVRGVQGHGRGSVRASTTRSATKGRTFRIFVFARVGWTRLVSRMTNRSRSGSSQIDVPVNPVCPKACAKSLVPALECSEGVSQPRAREEPGGKSWRRVNCSTKDGGRRRRSEEDGDCLPRLPPTSSDLLRPSLTSSNHSANRAKSPAVLNNPACPEIPPKRPVFSSCTSPRIMRCRNTVSISVGAMRSRHSAGGK